MGVRRQGDGTPRCAVRGAQPPKLLICEGTTCYGLLLLAESGMLSPLNQSIAACPGQLIPIRH